MKKRVLLTALLGVGVCLAMTVSASACDRCGHPYLVHQRPVVERKVVSVQRQDYVLSVEERLVRERRVSVSSVRPTNEPYLSPYGDGYRYPEPSSYGYGTVHLRASVPLARVCSHCHHVLGHCLCKIKQTAHVIVASSADLAVVTPLRVGGGVISVTGQEVGGALRRTGDRVAGLFSD